MSYKENYFLIEPDVRLHYIDEGKGRPLLFVTGFSGNAEGFSYQIDYFSKYMRVLSIDPRNHGKSSYSATGNTYYNQGMDLGKFIEGMDLKNIILVGWSFGALACLNYMEKFGTERVSAYITIDNPPKLITEDPSEYRAGDLDMLRSMHFDSFSSQQGFYDFVEKNFIDGIFFINPPQDKAKREELINVSLRLPLKVGDELIVDGHLADKRDVMSAVSKKIPCLFYVAAYRKEAGLRCLARDYPEAEVKAMGNHMVFYEFPEEFNESLYDYLVRHNLLL